MLNSVGYHSNHWMYACSIDRRWNVYHSCYTNNRDDVINSGACYRGYGDGHWWDNPNIEMPTREKRNEYDESKRTISRRLKNYFYHCNDNQNRSQKMDKDMIKVVMVISKRKNGFVSSRDIPTFFVVACCF